MGRLPSFVLFAAVWTFVGMPALCAGGVLTHPCACPHSQDSDHQEEEGCGHETDCESDPCEVVVARPQEGQDSGQWLSSTLADAHPFAATLSPQSSAPGFLGVSSPPLPFARDPRAIPTITTVLLI